MPALRRVCEGGLAAVVSDAPADLRAKRRDLIAHELVLEQLRAAGSVLPMKFGMLARDDEAVRAALRSGAARYESLLSRIDGHSEFNVKGAYHEVALLHQLLRRSPVLLEQHAALQAAGGGAYHEQVTFGERVAAAVELQRVRDAELTVARLGPHASEVRLAPPVQGCFVNVSFLVASGREGELETALDEVQRELLAYASLVLHGPLPPYSFVGDEASI
jgi:hypothetical protein